MWIYIEMQSSSLQMELKHGRAAARGVRKGRQGYQSQQLAAALVQRAASGRSDGLHDHKHAYGQPRSLSAAFRFILNRSSIESHPSALDESYESFSLLDSDADGAFHVNQQHMS